MSNELLGLVMLASMIGIIFVGVPISFTLLYIALVFGSLGLGIDPTFNLAYLQIFGSMKDDVLPAVPLFIFMGFMSEQAGLMNRLFETLRQILAPVRGSLYLAVLITATIFAMATGIIGAAVTVLGIIAGPMMVKAGYDGRQPRHPDSAKHHAAGDGTAARRSGEPPVQRGNRSGLHARRTLHRVLPRAQLLQS